MRFVSYRHRGRASYGVQHADGFVVDLPRVGADVGKAPPASLQGLIECGGDGLDLAAGARAAAPPHARLASEEIELLAPLPQPVRLRDASLFLEHMEASLGKIGKSLDPAFRAQPIFYNANHLVMHGPDSDIFWPAESTWMDYELEIACVIGRAGSRVSPEEARRHIFGFTIFNDWSARDLQLGFMAAGLGPSGGKDFASSLGPCVVTLDELGDPYDLTMTARVNGVEWSRGSTASMFHSWEDAIAAWSRLSPLVPGEVIGSGTVLGGCGFELDRRLSDGDVVELDIEGIGTLRNRVVVAPADAAR